MGLGAARTLLRKGFEVHACDARPEVVRNFAREGGIAASSPAEVGQRAKIVLILVVNADQTEQVLFGPDGAVSTLAKGSVVMSSSTVAPEFSIQLGQRLKAAGLLMIDGPVSGGAARAAKGELSVMASGEDAAFRKAKPLLDAVAAKVYRLGDKPGQGSKVKMINQLLAGVHIAASAEAMALGIKAGVDPHVLYEVISNSAGSSWMFQNRVPHILAGDYAPLSAVNIFVKDLGIVLESARKMTFPLPLTASAHQMFLGAAGKGLGYEDDSAVIKVYQALSGIRLPKPAKAKAAKGRAAKPAAARKVAAAKTTAKTKAAKPKARRAK
jgi:3-hydroxyisobutyrate dehydrogenase-like beta-hydroxyacid dehydrogenase